MFDTATLKLWFFVVGLSFFIIVGSITVHEMGHASAGLISGCTINNIALYKPAAEITCSTASKYIFVALGGILANFLLGILFLLSNRLLINNIAYMFIGFGLYSVKSDLELIGFPIILSSIVSFLGVITILYSLYLLCKVEIKELNKVAS